MACSAVLAVVLAVPPTMAVLPIMAALGSGPVTGSALDATSRTLLPEINACGVTPTVLRVTVAMWLLGTMVEGMEEEVMVVVVLVVVVVVVLPFALGTGIAPDVRLITMPPVSSVFGVVSKRLRISLQLVVPVALLPVAPSLALVIGNVVVDT